MGVTLTCNKTGRSADLGGGGFLRFRSKVAELCSKEFGDHYRKLEAGISFASQKDRDAFFDAFDAETERLIEEGFVDVRVVDFCLQSDCDGKIKYGACKLIYEKIKDYDDDIVYGYFGRPDRAMFRDLKQIFKDCVNHRCGLHWD